MSLTRYFEDAELNRSRGARSHSAQGLATTISSPAMKIPLPPRMWITGKYHFFTQDFSSRMLYNSIAILATYLSVGIRKSSDLNVTFETNINGNLFLSSLPCQL